MSSVNSKTKTEKKVTHEGGKASSISYEQELKRSVCACMLWEDSFYESGMDITERIKSLVTKINPKKVAELAVEARSEHNLRHIPLLLVRELIRNNYPAKNLLRDVIQRPDEITEFLAIYWKDGKTPLAAQAKKGLGMAFNKFSEYQIAKYKGDRDKITLKDAMRICHPFPESKKNEAIFKALKNGTLKTPDTWEVALSAGKDKKETWERLMKEGKLGALALLRNLRNMEKEGVDKDLIKDSMLKLDISRILPFRFIAAARYAPSLEETIERLMLKNIDNIPKMDEKTLMLVDVSGSMDDPLSLKSDMKRIDAACGLAIILRELCKNIAIYSFSNEEKEIPLRRGFALRDAIVNSQKHGGTYLARALQNAPKDYERIVVITDEQTHDGIVKPVDGTKAYVINVASYQNGIGYDKWVHINGFSEAIVNFIREFELIERR